MPRTIHSVNPATEQIIASYELADKNRVEQVLDLGHRTFGRWKKEPLVNRRRLMREAARLLRVRKSELALMITLEMGKPLAQSEAEIEKCAWNCDVYAESAADLLADQPAPSGAAQSYVQFLPLGMILAVMPWNFPFWQVFRFAAPSLMAGNTAILKHASNVSGCSLSIAAIFREAGFPEGAFQSLLIPGSEVAPLIEDERVAAVTLTGSDSAGRQVGAGAGRAIKKSVLELGGSDPFIVLADADLEAAAATGVKSRFQNTGQSCIAAKRFIIVEEAFDSFRERFVETVRHLRTGNPLDPATDVGPLARADLRQDVAQQVRRSVEQGARVLAGGKELPGRGFFYEPTVLDAVRPETVAGREEVFGPVAALMKVRDVAEAVEVANSTPFGLGSSVWTGDLEQAQRIAREIEAGQVFINGMVASDPRLPFGGVKQSGYGRELSEYGIREFVNIQTVWIGSPSRRAEGTE
jgi:acyl-CoA reductase-like NAD-dependent aldehyde dehydrogenase